MTTYDHDANCRCRLCLVMRLVAVVAFLTLAAAGSCWLLGCGTSPRAAAYGAELQECVAKNESRAAADDCRDGVARRYGRDGGR